VRSIFSLGIVAKCPLRLEDSRAASQRGKSNFASSHLTHPSPQALGQPLCAAGPLLSLARVARRARLPTVARTALAAARTLLATAKVDIPTTTAGASYELAAAGLRWRAEEAALMWTEGRARLAVDAAWAAFCECLISTPWLSFAVLYSRPCASKLCVLGLE